MDRVISYIYDVWHNRNWILKQMYSMITWRYNLWVVYFGRLHISLSISALYHVCLPAQRLKNKQSKSYFDCGIVSCPYNTLQTLSLNNYLANWIHIMFMLRLKRHGIFIRDLITNNCSVMAKVNFELWYCMNYPVPISIYGRQVLYMRKQNSLSVALA